MATTRRHAAQHQIVWRVIVSVLVLLALPLIVKCDMVVVSVFDPQGRLVVDADVALSCPVEARAGLTDSDGQFVFLVAPTENHCSLKVTHTGFGAVEKILDKNDKAISIVLHLPAIEEEVSVTSKSQDLKDLSNSWIGSASVSDQELQGISNDTQDLINYAKALAGADTSRDVVYVDGVPSATLPPAQMVGRIDVNTNPFSAEYSDPGMNHINITTKNADRTIHFNAGGNGFGWGGQNPLGQNLSATTHGGNFGISGGVPHSPLTFSLRTNLSSSHTEQPIEAVNLPGSSVNATTATVSNQSYSGQVSLHYSPTETLNTNLTYSDLQSAGTNIGAGGLTLPEAASDSHLRSREARFTFTRSGAAFVWRGGVDATQSSSLLDANSSGLGMVVIGSFVAGGPAVLSSQAQHTNWLVKNVVESKFKQRLWSAGLIIAGTADSRNQQPNPAGVLQFSSTQSYADALAGNPTGTLFVSRGFGTARYSSTTASPFLQAEVLHAEHVLITAGVRADYQSGFGTLISPRISLAAQASGFIVRAGAGMFAHDFSTGMLLHVVQDDGFHLRPYVLQDVSLAAAQAVVSSSDLVSQDWVGYRFSPNLTRPRDYMAKISVEHPFGALVPGVEYTWTETQHLLGSDRLPVPSGWLDVLESNRLLRRQQVDMRLQYRWKRQTFVAHYDWIQSSDNSAGPFSYPEYSGDLANEWARTAGISPHNFTAVASLQLPLKISTSLIETLRGSAPYNITSAQIGASGLFNLRDGLPRNSGDGPGYASFDMYASRRIAVPLAGKKVRFTVGLRGSNLLNNRNYVGVGSVIGSPLFGRGLAATPSRAVQCWISAD